MHAISSSVPTFLQSTTAQFSERLAVNRQTDESDKNNTTETKKSTESTRSEELSGQRQLQSLKSRDREVKAHELAHASVGGQYASGASFTYEKGSDGVLYAVAGEVSISTSAVANDPKATLEKALVIQRAALAPANPSSQDRSVAAAASSLAQVARVEINQLIEVERYADSAQQSSADSIDEMA